MSRPLHSRNRVIGELSNNAYLKLTAPANWSAAA